METLTLIAVALITAVITPFAVVLVVYAGLKLEKLLRELRS